MVNEQYFELCELYASCGELFLSDLPLRCCSLCNRVGYMKTITVRLPEPLVAEIEAESRARKCSKSDVVRERLQQAARARQSRSTPLSAIADLIGSAVGLPRDLSARKKRYLKATGYGRKSAR